MEKIEFEKKKIDWLSVLQGFSMLLVVIGHVSLTNVPGDTTTPIATGIETVIYSFVFLWNILDLMPDVRHFIAICVGIAFSFSLCINVANKYPNLFRSFRDYTFQIFLLGIFFQMAIRWIYIKMDNEMLFAPMWILSVIIGIYIPTIIAKFIKKYAPHIVKLCLGL